MIFYSDMVKSRTPTNYWRLNEASGVYTATDEMGANNGTYTNPYEPTKHIASPSAINDDSYAITCVGNVDMGQNISWWTEPLLIEFWYKMLANNSALFRIYSASGTSLELLHDTSSRLQVRAYSSGVTLNAVEPWADPGTDWHYALVILHSNTVWVHRDGNFACGDTSASWTGMYYYADSHLYFPSEANPSSSIKSLDEAAIYNWDWYSGRPYQDWWNHLNDRNLLPAV